MDEERQIVNGQTEKSGKPLLLCDLTPDHQKATMVWLWRKMKSVFGQSWVRQYGEVDGDGIDDWHQALLAFNSEQIKRGVIAAAEWDRDFPPTFGQFRKLCLTVVRDGPKPENRKYLEPPEKKINPEGLERVQREQAKVKGSSTQRDAQWVADYDKLCRARWGDLDPQKRAEYLAR
jgi:hypothetical protein